MEYEFTLKGTMPLLMHADDVMASDELIKWRKDPKNKTLSVPGDDRSPAWTWHTYVYHDGEHLAIPQECIMAALRFAGAKIPLPKGKGTFRALSQSGLLIGSDLCEFSIESGQIPVAEVHALRDLTFSQQIQGVRDLGFDLLVKRAKVGSAKHVRVRPKFDNWTVRGTISVSEPAITEAVLTELFGTAGRLAGLCDWRPGSPAAPGPYGMFTALLSAMKGAKKRAG